MKRDFGGKSSDLWRAWLACAVLAFVLLGGCDEDGAGNGPPPPPDPNQAGWVCSTNTDEVVKFTIDGSEELLRVDGDRFFFPRDIAVDMRDGAVWVADRYNNRLVRVTADGLFDVWTEPMEHFRPSSVSVDDSNGNVWVTDKDRSQVLIFDEDAELLCTITGFNFPFHLMVDQSDGGCWVADEGYPTSFVCKLPAGLTGTVARGGVQTVYFEADGVFFCVAEEASGGVWVSLLMGDDYLVGRYNSSGNPVGGITGLGEPSALALDEGRGILWISDNSTGKLYRIESDLSGMEAIENLALSELGGFFEISDIAVNRNNGDAWVADKGSNEVGIVKADGSEILVTLTGFSDPHSVALRDVVQ